MAYQFIFNIETGEVTCTEGLKALAIKKNLAPYLLEIDQKKI